MNVKKSMTYAELRELIDREVSEQEDRFAILTLSGRPSAEKVKLESASVTWDLPGDKTGYTVFNENNCTKTLDLIAARGWHDMLVAVYEKI